MHNSSNDFVPFFNDAINADPSELNSKMQEGTVKELKNITERKM